VRDNHGGLDLLPHLSRASIASCSGLKEFVIRRIAMSLAVAILALASIPHLDAASLAGVTLPDTVTVGNTHLMLNGLGLRTKFVVKVYVAGLYLMQKSSDGDAIVKADEAKRIVMHFLHGVSKNQMADAFQESFRDNAIHSHLDRGGSHPGWAGRRQAMRE